MYMYVCMYVYKYIYIYISFKAIIYIVKEIRVIIRFG